MKLHEIDWTDGKRYTDGYCIYEVWHDDLFYVSSDGSKTRTTRIDVLREISELDFEEVEKGE
jgi:hypothetical protein